jgi:hypothetical protein
LAFEAAAVGDLFEHPLDQRFLPTFLATSRMEMLPKRRKRNDRMIKATPFDYPYDGNLDPRATALIVIDMQRDFLFP